MSTFLVRQTQEDDEDDLDPDEDEFLEVREVSRREMDRLIRSGRIRDSKTLVAYLAWRSVLAG